MLTKVGTNTPKIERAHFIVGQRDSGKTTQIRSIFQDVRIHKHWEIPTLAKVPDLIYQSDEAGLLVRLTSPHESGETAEDFFQKIEAKISGTGLSRCNFICPLHHEPYKEIGIPTVELIQRFYDRFQPERLRVVFLNPDRKSRYFHPSTLEQMQDDLRGYGVGIEVMSIDARHRTGQGTLLADVSISAKERNRMPSMLPHNLDDLTDEHLQALIDNRVPENLTVEFKQELWGTENKGVKEFLKDVSALANTAGGWLVVGIREEESVAADFLPIRDVNADKLIASYLNRLRDCIEPRLFGVQIKEVPIGGGFVLVIRVPPSLIPPHRTVFDQSYRFYLRTSKGAYEADYQELQRMFLQSASIKERFAAFRAERIEVLQKLETPVRIIDDRDRLLVHIMPLSMDGTADLDRAYAECVRFGPINHKGFSPLFNADGLVVKFADGGQVNVSYTQLFRDGRIEAIRVGLIEGKEEGGYMIADAVRQMTNNAIARFMDGLQLIQINPPFYVGVSLLGVRGLRVNCNLGRPIALQETLPLPMLNWLLPLCIIHDFGASESYEKAMKPAWDALWNAGGWSGYPLA